MKLFAFIYNGFVLGMLFSVLAFQDEWLEMRMNIGLIIFITMLLAIVSYSILKYRNIIIKYKNLKLFSFSSLVLSFLISFIILGGKRMLTLPASILREALGITFISFDIINIIIMFVLVVGIILITTIKSKNKEK